MKLGLGIGAIVVCAGLATSVSTAEAGIEACGDIYLEAGVQCEMVPPGVECEAECTPLKLEVACAAELSVSCEGQCSVSAEASCTASCQGSCEGSCDVEPGEFNCQAYCEGQCSGDCAAQCSSNANQSQCEASCKASCSGYCTGDCDVVPPSATCQASCEASCSGSCEAEINAECQVDCQSSGYAECTAEMQGGCEVACNTEEGALFCDGSYVDVGDKLDECVQALKDLFNIEVDGYASAECSGNMCEAEAGGSASCSVSGDSKPFGLALLALVVGLLISRRNRRR